MLLPEVIITAGNHLEKSLSATPDRNLNKLSIKRTLLVVIIRCAILTDRLKMSTQRKARFIYYTSMKQI